MIYGTLICFGIVLLILGQSSKSRRTGEIPDASRSQAVERVATKHKSEQKSSAVPLASQTTAMTLVDDDGKTLWASPTNGPPINLAYLPPGVIFVLAIRPEAIAEHDEGDKIFDAGGLLAKRGLEIVSRDVPSISGVKQAVIGFSADRNANWSVTQVVRMSGEETATEYVTSQFPDALNKTQNNLSYWLNGDRAYFAPASDEQLLVVTTPESIVDMIDLAGDPPPLRRDVARLLTHTDADRHITILFAPNSMFREGRSMFDGPMARLREPLSWFLGEELSAASLSLHWGKDFYFEFLAAPTLDASPEKASRILADRVHEIPEKLEQYVVDLDPQPYSRAVVARFPAMIRALSAYTRNGFESDQAILNGYLPVAAGHNLLMAAELTLAETPPGVRPPAEASSPLEYARPEGASIEDKLLKRTSMRFTRDTLEAALEQLSRDIGVPIVIRGADLQAEGITKNQSFGMNLQDKTSAEILVAILRLANPDKTAIGANDVKQKLVYVIGRGEGGEGQIFVTTRSAAAAKGERLPAAFEPVNP
jgi:hypothetical protein